MAKSDDNFLTLEHTFNNKGIHPLVYRFASFQTHYRKPMEFSDEAVEAARNGLQHLQNQIRQLIDSCTNSGAGSISAEYKGKFLQAVNDDLNMPRAMAVVQETLKSGLSEPDKLASVFDFDGVLGLDLNQIGGDEGLPEDVQKLVSARQQARIDKKWDVSDRLRDEIQALGYVVQDTKGEMKVFKS